MARTARKSAPAKRPASGSLSAPQRGGVGKTYTSPPTSIALAAPGHRMNQVILEIDGLFHGEASYEGRVFLANPRANENTPLTAENGYAGSFYVFGHGGCLGDPGHCEVSGPLDPYDFRPGHPLTPAKMQVDITETIQEVAKTSATATITVVPIVNTINELCDPENVFRFTSMRLISFNP